MEEETLEDYLQDMYYDSKHPGVFSGPEKLLKAAREGAT